jgi:hypothetical protein
MRLLAVVISRILKKASGVSFIEQLHMRYARHLGDGDAVHVRADRMFEVAHGQRQRLIDAHHHVGTAAFDARRIFLDQLARIGFFRRRHAVFDVELDHVGAAGVRLVDEFFNVDRDIHQRAPDGEFTIHGASFAVIKKNRQ